MIAPTGDNLLSRYAKNMTEDARQGQLDPVLCRDHEIDLMIDILCRRRKNNPVVVGEAGVGKSALIEGLALRIVAGQVPDKLKNTDIMTLDLGALQAGASVKGEFEKRFKGLMAEVISSAVPVILFIDEAHTLIGAGNQQGGLDISNLLKPALARGELKTIAATTWSEYKKYFEKDAALSRRFQLVKVSEPTASEATIILRGLSAVYEKSHGVLIDDEALQAAATLSERYLSGRQLPDKAIDVLDTACARVAINLSSPPKQISALTTQSHQCKAEIHQLEREIRIGLRTDTTRLNEIHAQYETAQQALQTLVSAWRQQQLLVQEIIALKGLGIKAIQYQYGGQVYVKITGYASLRRILQGTRYKINSPQILELGIGKAGINGGILEGAKFCIWFSLAYRTVQLIFKSDHDVAAFIGNITMDIAKIIVTIFVTKILVMAGGALTTVAASFGVIFPIAAGIVLIIGVGFLITLTLDYLDRKYHLSDKLISVIREGMKSQAEIEKWNFEHTSPFTYGLMNTHW